MTIKRNESGGVITSFFGTEIQHNGSALSFLDAIPIRKIIIWSSFLGLLYLLKAFFGIVIGTFVIAYIGNSMIHRLERRYPNRKLLIIGYFLTIVLFMSGFGFWAITLAVGESKVFVEKIQNNDPYTSIYKEMNASLPPSIMNRIDKALLEISNSKEDPNKPDPSAPQNLLEQVTVTPNSTGFLIAIDAQHSIEINKQGQITRRISSKTAQTPKNQALKPTPNQQTKKPGNSLSKTNHGNKTNKKTAKPKIGQARSESLSPKTLERKAENLGQALQKALKDYASLAIKYISKFFGLIGQAIIQTIISLIFAFLIVWDLPKIGKGIRNLENSRLGEAYTQVAPSVVNFGQLLGKAFQAQTLIALTNTALTALGMTILFIPGLGFLSLIVFVCSFIPVAGVFISTAPMAIVALVSGGLVKCLAVVVMVILVHAVEAYILNPVIYSAHLKLHPLLVLVVLVVAEHAFGIWGLIIAVPLTVYVYKHVILGELEESQAEPEQLTSAQAERQI